MVSLEEVQKKSKMLVDVINEHSQDDSIYNHPLVSVLKNACSVNVVLTELLMILQSKYTNVAFDVELFLEGFHDI